MSGQGATYRDAGVDIAAGDALVEAIRPAARRTDRSGTMGGLGGFGALFDLKAAGYRDPILVSATDGVGTKLLLAIESGRHDTVGQDLVAMVVNDLVVSGAEPLFFLDYFATGRLAVEDAARVVRGIARACEAVGCALVGGETAEMPGLYAAGHYDLAGFAVGAVERGALLPGTVAPGDIVLGLPSSGVHSNGFSLVRRIVAGSGLGWDAPAPFGAWPDPGGAASAAAAPGTPDPARATARVDPAGVPGVAGAAASVPPGPPHAGAGPVPSLAESLLVPTRLYVRPVLALARAGLLRAAAHITGGGLPGNLPRVLPAGCVAALDAGAWSVPPVFGWLAQAGGVAPEEMLRVFNCGIGMALVVSNVASATALLSELGEAPVVIGRIEARVGEEPAVRIAPPPGWPAAPGA